MLYQLKCAGISQSDFVTVHLSVVRICLPCVAHRLSTIPATQYRKDTEKSIKMHCQGAIYAEILGNVGLQS